MPAKNMVMGVKVGGKVKGKTTHLLFKDKECLNIVITNLISCTDGITVLLYSRDTGGRTMKWKYNKKGVSNYRVVQAVTWLEHEGYVFNTIASPFQLYDEDRDCSSLLPTDKFVKKFGSVSESVKVSKSMRDESPLVILRDKEGNSVKYRDSKDVQAIEQEMVLMNNSNAMFDVRDENSLGIDTVFIKIFRESFEINGRMYSVGFHGLENRVSKGRLKTLIDGKPVAECDFNAMHLMLLADINNHAMPDGDAYMNILPEGMKDKYNRQVLKLCVTRLLNSPSKRSALLSFRGPLEEVDGHTFSSTSHVLEVISTALGSLMSFMYTDKLGLRLTFIESTIMTDVVQYFVSIGRPVLPIHDSACVFYEDRNLLAAVMSDFYRKHTGTTRKIVMSCSSFIGKYVKEDCSC